MSAIVRKEENVSDIEVVTLQGLAQGAVLELFQVELRRVLDDIADVNRKADAPREVTFKVRVVPDVKRETADVQISAQTKLGVLKIVETRFFLGRLHGENVAVENNPMQQEMFDPPPVVPIRGDFVKGAK